MIPSIYLANMVHAYGYYILCWNNKGRFGENREIDTLITKRLYVENKAKLSQLEIVNKQYCGGVVSFQLREFRFVLYR